MRLKNDFNLNLLRYRQSSTPEDQRTIDAHLNGGIPEAGMCKHWAATGPCACNFRLPCSKPCRPRLAWGLTVAPAATSHHPPAR